MPSVVDQTVLNPLVKRQTANCGSTHPFMGRACSLKTRNGCTLANVYSILKDNKHFLFWLYRILYRLRMAWTRDANTDWWRLICLDSPMIVVDRCMAKHKAHPWLRLELPNYHSTDGIYNKRSAKRKQELSRSLFGRTKMACQLLIQRDIP